MLCEKCALVLLLPTTTNKSLRKGKKGGEALGLGLELDDAQGKSSWFCNLCKILGSNDELG
jgi:hypothetical protein